MRAATRLRSGVTLLEVMLALVILSGTVVGMLRASSQCLSVSNRVRHFDAARRTLDRGNLSHPVNVTNEVETLTVAPVEYELEGYLYSREFTADAEDADSFLITTRVAWRSEGRERSLEVFDFLYSTNHP